MGSAFDEMTPASHPALEAEQLAAGAITREHIDGPGDAARRDGRRRLSAASRPSGGTSTTATATPCGAICRGSCDAPRPTMRLLLAPMEGLLDHCLRDVLTRAGGVDRCVSEFIRVTDQLLPARVFLRLMPELAQGSRTAAGTPVRAQLLGSDAACLADNAAALAALGAEGIDLNFGCPAPTVNRHRGGAVLLDEPELVARDRGGGAPRGAGRRCRSRPRCGSAIATVR